MTIAQYESDLGRPLTPNERAVVEQQEASIARRQSWYASLAEEFEPARKRRDANLEKVRRGLFHV